MFRALSSLVCILILASCSNTEARGPIVMAASSLQQPLEALADQWADQGHARPVLSFASSAALARQIDNGNATDIFISADSQWTDYLVSAGKIRGDGALAIARNSLVIAWHVEDDRNVITGKMPQLVDLEGTGPVATGDPQSVPLGRFAQEALQAEGAWNSVKSQIVGTHSARAALVLVNRGEAQRGILYHSDAQSAENVAILADISPESHSKIEYVAVRLPSSGHPDAEMFLNYLASGEAARTFDTYGFKRP